MKKNKTLPMKKPLLDAYPHHGNIMSILESNKYLMPAVINHYMQLAFDTEIDRIDFNIALNIKYYTQNYPFVLSHGINREFVNDNWKKIEDFIISCIDHGYYVHLLVDTYYLHAYNDFYQRIHFEHNVMIYGYDCKEKVYDIADAFENGKYSFRKAYFSELEKSYDKHSDTDWIEGFQLYKIREKQLIGVGYDIDMMKQQIDEYVNGLPSDCIILEESARRRRGDFAYGIAVYQILQDYIKINMEQGSECDIRIFYVLLDHKRYLKYMCYDLYTLGRINKADYYYNQFKHFEREAQKICNSVLKYNVTLQSILLTKAISRLSDMALEEKAVLQKLPEDLAEESIYDNRMVTGIVECDHILLEYIGEWEERTDHGMKYCRTWEEGAVVRLQFYGNDIKVFAVQGELFGELELQIDGKNIDTIDLHSEGSNHEQEVYHSNQLKLGYHTIKVSNKSKKNIKNRINISKIISSCVDTDLKHETIVKKSEYDYRTRGNWEGVYGQEGYEIIGGDDILPDYVDRSGFIFRNPVFVWLYQAGGDSRALHAVGDRSIRSVAYYLKDTEFTVEIIVSGDELHPVSFYTVDYDRLGRVFAIEFTDGDTDKVLFNDIIEDFEEGIYLNYMISGYVKVKFKCIEGPDTVLSGVFFQ